jgi:hypothetical protein
MIATTEAPKGEVCGHVGPNVTGAPVADYAHEPVVGPMPTGAAC